MGLGRCAEPPIRTPDPSPKPPSWITGLLQQRPPGTPRPPWTPLGPFPSASWSATWSLQPSPFPGPHGPPGVQAGSLLVRSASRFRPSPGAQVASGAGTRGAQPTWTGEGAALSVRPRSGRRGRSPWVRRARARPCCSPPGSRSLRASISVTEAEASARRMRRRALRQVGQAGRVARSCHRALQASASFRIWTAFF